MSSWLDNIPSHERAKIRNRLRSPEEYERLREKVKSPEDLEREMKWNEVVAELKFALETEPTFKDALKNQISEDIKEQGIETVLENIEGLSEEGRQALEQGHMEVNAENGGLTVAPEGRVGEKLPVRKSFGETYVSQFGANV